MGEDSIGLDGGRPSVALHRGSDGDQLDVDGDVEQLYLFGGRSVSIRDAAGGLVFDSDDTIERAMMARCI